jgi:PII-like signaling protein
MDVPGQAARLRIFIGETEVYERRPLVEALVFKAQQMGLGGATAMHGFLGFGPKNPQRPGELLLSGDRPVVVEVVDSREMINRYLDAVQPMIRSGLITLDTIQVLRYGATTGQAGLC